MDSSAVNALDRVTGNLAKLPGIGEKTAMRLALHLLRHKENLAADLAQSLLELKERVRLCPTCCALTESALCTYCSHPKRPRDVICVIEDIADMLAIERTHPYRWNYHVLHGVLSPLDGVTPNDLKIRELLVRLADDVREVILATNCSVEGEATAVYLAKILQPMGIKTTRIAQGIPMGSHIEYLDSATLTRALDLRKELHVAHQPV